MIKVAYYACWFFFGLLFAAWLSQANAMEFTQIPYGDTTSDRIAIAATGEIFYGDEDKLVAAIGPAKGGIIYFSSDGGNAWAGIRIGAEIYSRPDFIATVAKGDKCYSACAVAWIGASRRSVGYGARVGFHGAFIIKDGRSVASAPINAAVGGYLAQLGLSIEAVMFATGADPDHVSYLTPRTADEYSIRAGFFNPNNQIEWHGGTVVAATQPAPAQPVMAMDAKAKARETAELPNIATACHTVVDPKTYDFKNCYSQETESLHWAITTQESYPREKRRSCWKESKDYPIMRWKHYKLCVAGQ